MRFRGRSMVIACALLLAARAAEAASVTIQAGQTYSLGPGDLVLTGPDTLDANGTVDSPCVIVGNGHAIVANALTGHVKIQNCILQGLGGTTRDYPGD